MQTKTKIRIKVCGAMPKKLNTAILKKWKSKVFELINPDDMTINFEEFQTLEGPHTDDEIKNALLLYNEAPADFTIAIVNIQLEGNYYSRRIGDNCVIFSFNQISKYITKADIPLENAILRALYLYSLVFRAKKKLPSLKEETITHEATRKCIFDFNRQLYDIVETLDPPHICIECELKYKNGNTKVSDEIMKAYKNELSRIRKPLYFQIRDFIREKPIIAFVVSSIYAVILGTIGSLIASYLWQYLEG
jgi:hypothetical protein